MKNLILALFVLVVSCSKPTTPTPIIATPVLQYKIFKIVITCSDSATFELNNKQFKFIKSFQTNDTIINGDSSYILFYPKKINDTGLLTITNEDKVLVKQENYKPPIMYFYYP